MIANVSPSSASSQETNLTLQFAEGAKELKAPAKINENSSESIIFFKEEITRLNVLIDDRERQLLLKDSHTAMLIKEIASKTQTSEEELLKISDSINGENVMAHPASEPDEDEEGKAKEAKVGIFPFPHQPEESLIFDAKMQTEPEEESQNLICTRVNKSIPLREQDEIENPEQINYFNWNLEDQEEDYMIKLESSLAWKKSKVISFYFVLIFFRKEEKNKELVIFLC
jgi:hypothetical protein